MFILTQEEGDIESGAYATKDVDGTTVVQFFVDKDDAICYSEQLKAVDYELEITEVPDEAVEKLSEALGYPYTVVEPGEFICPRMEILEHFIAGL